MSSNPTPYIGSKISLVSSSEIRYEGVLYNINTEEATIALQSVRCFGTEGRKMPEIPPSNEVYDFIIFSGQDIKDLTVLESGNSPAINDPAILSVNKPPPGGKDALEALKGADRGLNLKGKAPDGKGKGYEGPKGYDGKDGKGYDGGYDGKGYGGKGYQNGKSYDNGRGYQSSGWSNPGKGYDYPVEAKGGYGKDKGKEKGKDMPKGKDAGKGKGDAMDGKGKDGKGKGDFKGDGKGKSDGKGHQGKKGDKGSPKGKDGKGKDGKGKDGKGKGKGEGKGKDGRGEGKGGRRRGGGGNGIVGELLPEENADTKRQCAEEFDFVSSAQKFDKVSDLDALKPLEGYNKGKSFFDSISCEATERSGEAGRQRSDRDKAREADVEAFGDSNRRGKGQRKGKS